MSKTTKAKAAKPAGAKAPTVKPAKAQRVPKLSSVEVPLAFLKAAVACSSQEKTRHYLKGVRVHQAEKGKVRVLVSFFGRETPVELDFLQVQRIV